MEPDYAQMDPHAQSIDDLSMMSGEHLDMYPEEPEIDFLSLAQQAHSSSTGWFDTNVRKSFTESLNQFHAKHDGMKYQSKFYEHRSKYYYPKTRASLRKHEAALAAAYFTTKDVVSIEAFNPDDKAELAAAQFYSQIMNLRLTSSGPRSIPWYQFLLGAYQDTMVYGIAISRQVWCYEKKRPDPILIDPSLMRFDPSCNWIDPVGSSPYLIEEIPMYIHQIKEKIARGEFNEVSDAQLANARRPDTNSVSSARNPERSDPMNRSNSIEEYELVMVHLNIMKQKGRDWVFYTLGTESMLTDPEPIENVYLHGERPYVIGKCVLETHKPYPTSPVGMTRDIQRILNDSINLRMDNGLLANNNRWVAKRGALTEFESIQKNIPGTITMVNDIDKDIRMMNHPDVNPSTFKEQSLLEIAHDSISGGFDSSTMQSNRSMNETVGGISMIAQSGNQLGDYQITTFNVTMAEPVLRQLLKIEQRYETDENIIMLAGNKAQLVKQYGSVNLGDMRMKDLMLSVQVGMGSTNPATKVEKLMMAVRSLQQAVPQAAQMLDSEEVVKEVFGALGFKDGKRFINLNNLDPEKEELKKQVEQLQMELKVKRSPEVDAAQVKLFNAQTLKTLNEATFGAVQAAVGIAKVPACAPITDAIMQGNGYVPAPNGVDPNFYHPTLGQHIESMAQTDPDALAIAQQQAEMFDQPENNDPGEPATGENGFNAHIEGGQ